MAPWVMNLAAQVAAKCSACDLFTREPIGGLCAACVSDLPPGMRPKPESQQTVREKLCSRCGVVKPRDEFNRSQKALTGLSSECKDCRRAMNAESDTRVKQRAAVQQERVGPPPLRGSLLVPPHQPPPPQRPYPDWQGRPQYG